MTAPVVEVVSDGSHARVRGGDWAASAFPSGAVSLTLYLHSAHARLETLEVYASLADVETSIAVVVARWSRMRAIYGDAGPTETELLDALLACSAAIAVEREEARHAV